jgi:hypothetical protein
VSAATSLAEIFEALDANKAALGIEEYTLTPS